MKALDSRLQAAADFVTPGGRVVDVGTDHGYLPIWLVQEGRAVSAVAADINQMPLESAAANIAAEGLTGRIETCLTDGLTGVKLDGVTDIVAAGMGGQLIAEILSRRLPLDGKNLILQPMTQGPYLRNWLAENGFAILAETPAEKGGKLYTVINARQTGEKRACGLYESYTGKIPEAMHDPEKAVLARKYMEMLQKKIQTILLGLSRASEDNPDAAVYEELIGQIREVLK